jgi:hypothetical protein
MDVDRKTVTATAPVKELFDLRNIFIDVPLTCGSTT